MGSETYPPEIARLWEIVKGHPHVIGDFTWTGYDYLGEAGIGIYHYNAQSGIQGASQSASTRTRAGFPSYPGKVQEARQSAYFQLFVSCSCPYPVTVSVEGAGTLLGFGSANPSCEGSYQDAAWHTLQRTPRPPEARKSRRR